MPSVHHFCPTSHRRSHHPLPRHVQLRQSLLEIDDYNKQNEAQIEALNAKAAVLATEIV